MVHQFDARLVGAATCARCGCKRLRRWVRLRGADGPSREVIQYRAPGGEWQLTAPPCVALAMAPMAEASL